MATNKIKAPFFLDRANQERNLIVIEDLNGTRSPMTIGYTEHPAGTSLTTLLTDGDQRNYKVYTALLTQTGTSAPTATILENTLGTIVWARTGTGTYTGTLTGAFPAGTTYVTRILDAEQGETTVEKVYKAVRTNNNVITVTTIADAKLSNTPIEIKTFIVIEDVSGN